MYLPHLHPPPCPRLLSSAGRKSETEIDSLNCLFIKTILITLEQNNKTQLDYVDRRGIISYISVSLSIE